MNRNAFSQGRPNLVPVNSPDFNAYQNAPSNTQVSDRLDSFIQATRQIENQLSQERSKNQKLSQEIYEIQNHCERLIKENEYRLLEVDTREKKLRLSIQEIESRERTLYEKNLQLHQEYKKIRAELIQYQTAWTDVLQREKDAKENILRTQKIQDQWNAFTLKLSHTESRLNDEQKAKLSLEKDLQESKFKIQELANHLTLSESKLFELEKQKSQLQHEANQSAHKINSLEQKLAVTQQNETLLFERHKAQLSEAQNRNLNLETEYQSTLNQLNQQKQNLLDIQEQHKWAVAREQEKLQAEHEKYLLKLREEFAQELKTALEASCESQNKRFEREREALITQTRTQTQTEESEKNAILYTTISNLKSELQSALHSVDKTAHALEQQVLQSQNLLQSLTSKYETEAEHLKTALAASEAKAQKAELFLKEHQQELSKKIEAYEAQILLAEHQINQHATLNDLQTREKIRQLEEKHTDELLAQHRHWRQTLVALKRQMKLKRSWYNRTDSRWNAILNFTRLALNYELEKNSSLERFILKKNSAWNGELSLLETHFKAITSHSDQVRHSDTDKTKNLLESITQIRNQNETQAVVDETSAHDPDLLLKKAILRFNMNAADVSNLHNH